MESGQGLYTTEMRVRADSGDGIGYRALVECAREGIAFVGPEAGTILYCNEAYAKILGLKPRELIGSSFFDFLGEEEREKALRLRLLRLEGMGSQYEISVVAADGTRKEISATGSPVFGPDGSYEGAVQTILDVTERKRAEQALRESEERFRVTFEAAAVGMAHVALDGRWIRVNDKLSEIIGYSREELLELTFQDITHRDDLGTDLDYVRRVLEGEIRTYSMEKRYMRKDRSRIWVNLTVSLVRKHSGEPDCLFSIVEDVTPRKLAELVPDPLTPREVEVLCLIAEWQTNQQIACRLRYSLSTVKLHVQCLIAKLGVERRAQAVARAVEIGLIPPPR